MTYEDYQNATFDPEQYPVYRGKPKSDKERIEELEKACEETQELLDKQIEATYRLDKENAELKKDKKELCHSISEGGKACVYLNGQLTKAKQIIQEFLELNYSEFTKTNAVFLLADKFLKESE